MNSQIYFENNSILVPSEVDDESDEISVFFVKKGTTLDRVDIFNHVFRDQNRIYWVTLRDFDPEDLTELNLALEEYESDPESYLEKSSEIVKLFH